MTESFEWAEDVETRRVTVEIPASVEKSDLRRAIQVVSSMEDSTDDDADELLREYDRGFNA